MANFASELGTGLKNRLVPDETSLDRKIDFQREKEIALKIQSLGRAIYFFLEIMLFWE